MKRKYLSSFAIGLLAATALAGAIEISNHSEVYRVEASSPTLKEEVVYAQSFDGMQASNASEIWGQTHDIWYQNSDVTIIDNNGKNSVQITSTLDSEFNCIGGIQFDDVMAKLEIGKKYTMSMYIDFADVPDNYAFHVEPQPEGGQWTGVYINKDGVKSHNAATTTNIKYANHILSFDFICTGANPYAKLTMQNFGIGGKVIIDDMKVTKQRVTNAEAYDGCETGTTAVGESSNTGIPMIYNQGMDQGIKIAQQEGGNRYLQCNASNTAGEYEYHNFYMNNLPIEDNHEYRLSFDVIDKDYTEFYIRYNDNVNPCAAFNQNTCFSIDEYEYIKGASFDGTHVTFDFVASSEVNANFWQQVYVIVKHNAAIKLGIDNLQITDITNKPVFAATEEVQIGVGESAEGRVTGTLTYGTGDVRTVSASEINLDTSAVNEAVPGTYIAVATIVDELGLTYTANVSVKVGNVSITKPTLKSEDVYAADYSSFDVGTDASGIWAEEQLVWFEGSCVDVTVKEHDGSNKLEYVNKSTGEYSTLGGIGSGSTANLSALVPGQTYRFQAYVDVVSEANWTLFIEPQCREWTGINLKSTGAAPQNGATTSNVKYENKILSFDFTVTEPNTGMANVYAKFVAQNLAVGDKVYFDDVSISKVRVNTSTGSATTIDYESATAGIVQNPNTVAEVPYCWNASMDQGISVVEAAGNKYLQAKASNTSGANEWHNFYVNGLSFLQDNTPYRLSFDVVEKGYNEFYVRYNDNVTPCAAFSQTECVAIDQYDYILGATFDGTHVTFDFIPSSTVNANFWQQIYFIVRNDEAISFGIDNVKFEALSTVKFEAADVEIDVNDDFVKALNGTLSYTATDIRNITGAEMVYDSEEIDVTKVGTYNVTVYIADEFMNVYKDTIQVKVHSWDDGVETTAPTCETAGVRTYTCTCGDKKTEEIPALNHDYQFTEIVWDGFTAKAVYTCSHDATHKDEHACEVTNEETTAPKCGVAGERTYTATYDGHTDTKTEEITALTHDYQFVEIVWDGFTAKAIYVCSHDNKETEEHACTVTNEVTTAPTCLAAGVKTYTATYDDHTDTKTEELPVVEHQYKLVAEVAATYEATGVKAHYVCEQEGCTKLFVKNGDVYQEVTESDLVIAKLEKEPEESSSTSEEPSPSESEEPSESTSEVESSSTSSSSLPVSSSDIEKAVEEAKKGCGSAAIPSVIGLLTIAGALLVSKKRR